MIYVPQEMIGGYLNSFEKFLSILKKQMGNLSKETNLDNFQVPVGLFFILDEKHGGDSEAIDLIKKYKFLNEQSSYFIDFYFMGWNLDLQDYDIESANTIRKNFKKNKINLSFCNSELVIFDCCFNRGKITLDFTKAISINIDLLLENKIFSSLVNFIDALIKVCTSIRDNPNHLTKNGVTWEVSDKLGLLIAKDSTLNLFLKKFGSFFGAEKMVYFRTQEIGPALNIDNNYKLILPE